MVVRSVFPALAALLATAASAESQRGALSVSARVVPACEVGVSADVARIAAAESGSSERLTVVSCTAGATAQVTLERASASRPSSGTSAEGGTLYVTLTY